MAEEKEYDILKHSLVPSHVLLSEEEKNELMKKYNISLHQLPKIFSTDAAVKAVGAKVGDVLKIVRKSPTAGETTYFRLVIKNEKPEK